MSDRLKRAVEAYGTAYYASKLADDCMLAAAAVLLEPWPIAVIPMEAVGGVPAAYNRALADRLAELEGER